MVPFMVPIMFCWFILGTEEETDNLYNFLLFREMCVDAGIDDPELCDLLVNGTPLVGKSGSSNLFEAEDNIPAMSDVR